MGFFKKFLSDAANELKKNLESTKNEMSNALEEIKQDTINSASNSRDDDEEDDEEPKNLLGDFHDGVLTIREGITKIDDDSLEDYKHLRKIIFPASLEEIDDDAIDNQEELEELDFSRVTKLKTIPDSMVYCETKITQLIIPHGVTKVNDCFLREANPGVKVYVPDTVKEIGCISGNSDNDLIVYLFAHNLDVEEMEPDVKTLYVLPQDYASYARKLKDCESEARLREMPEEAMNIYPVAKSEPDSEPKVTAEPKQEPKFESMPELKSEPQKEETSGASDDGIFSARLEMLIKSALQDGILTEQERAIILRRAEKEGEDPDEVEMIIEARLAEMKQSTSPSEPNIKSESVSSTPKPNVENGGSYEDLLNKKKKELDDAKKVKYNSGANLLKYNTLHKEYTELLAAMESKKYVKVTEEDKYATSIDIPEGVTIIPDYCFSRCSSLESITLPSTIKQIGKCAFDGCSALTSIDIPEGVTIIPDLCFDGCSSMESITLPSTIKQIGTHAFDGCSALTSIDIPEGVTIIPDNCFKGCSSMESITLPSTIKQIGEFAFDGCSALTSIDIPEGVTIIPDYCFVTCKKLNSVTLPTTIKKIGDGAFDECNKLKTISIPNGCERLEELGNLASSPRIFLPPSLCSIDVISTFNHFYDLLIYCFAPQLEELEIFENCQELYVLPQYLDLYKSQAEAEEVEIDIKPMPDEYLYYYDN